MSTNTIETLVTAYLQKLQSLTTSRQEMEQMLTKLKQALRRNGIQLNIDINVYANNLRRSEEDLQKSTEPIVWMMEQLWQLTRTAALITSSLDLEHVLNEVMDRVIYLTGAERAYLMLRQGEAYDGPLQTRVARNWDQQTISEAEITFSRNVIDRVVEKGESMIVADAMSDTRFREAVSVLINEMRSIVCVPLTIRQSIIGVLYIENKLDRGVFTEHHLPVLAAFANQTAIAIENARLYARAKADLERAQSEIVQLRIEVDQTRLETDIKQVTETDYFRDLEAQIDALRASLHEPGED